MPEVRSQVVAKTTAALLPTFAAGGRLPYSGLPAAVHHLPAADRVDTRRTRGRRPTPAAAWTGWPPTALR